MLPLFRNLWRLVPSSSHPAEPRDQHDARANVRAGALVLIAWSVLVWNFSDIPAGVDARKLVASSDRHHFAAAMVAITANKPVLASVDADDEASQVVSAAPVDSSRETLLRKVALLHKGIQLLETTERYTASFIKQENVRGCLLDEQEMLLKVQHAPESIYLKWITGPVGREALVARGRYDDEMLVRESGWKGRLGVLSIDPEGSLAMAEARHPIYACTLRAVAQVMLDHHAADLEKNLFSQCRDLGEREFDNRPCRAFVIEYASRDTKPVYRKSLTLLDAEWNVPVYVRNYGWPDEALPEDEEETLVEFYSYSQIMLKPSITAAHFDREYDEYRLQ